MLIIVITKSGENVMDLHEPAVHDDSRFSAQAMRMIELICVFLFVSVFENLFCVSPWMDKVILVYYFIEYIVLTFSLGEANNI